MRIPSAMPARAAVRRSIASSAPVRSCTPSLHSALEYFIRGPSSNSKNAGGSS